MVKLHVFSHLSSATCKLAPAAVTQWLRHCAAEHKDEFDSLLLWLLLMEAKGKNSCVYIWLQLKNCSNSVSRRQRTEPRRQCVRAFWKISLTACPCLLFHRVAPVIAAVIYKQMEVRKIGETTRVTFKIPAVTLLVEQQLAALEMAQEQLFLELTEV